MKLMGKSVRIACEQPLLWEWVRNMIAPVLLGIFISVFMLLLEHSVHASGMSLNHTVVIIESFVEVGKGVPLLLSFFSEGLLSMLTFLGLLWHFGVHVGKARPSAVLDAPWLIPKDERIAHDWVVWLGNCWTLTHHVIYTSVKVAFTYDALHTRSCSQPFLLLIFIGSVAVAHMSYGLSKLANMGILGHTYATLADALLYIGFGTRLFSASCIAAFSHPASPNSRTNSAFAVIHDETWGWTHTEYAVAD